MLCFFFFFSDWTIGERSICAGGRTARLEGPRHEEPAVGPVKEEIIVCVSPSLVPLVFGKGMRCLSLCRTAPRRADGAAVPSMRSMATASPSFYETVNLLFPAVRRAIPRLERHSHPRQKQYSSFTVFTVPVLEDTYSYILYDHHSKEGLLVDPCEPELVLRTCERFASPPFFFSVPHHSRVCDAGTRSVCRGLSTRATWRRMLEATSSWRASFRIFRS